MSQAQRKGEKCGSRAYHATVRERLAPRLQAEGAADALAWLIERTQPI
jgi:hypothetical protein